VEVDIRFDYWVCRSKHICDDSALRTDWAGVGLEEIWSALVHETHEKEQGRRCQKNRFRDDGGGRAHTINNPVGGLPCVDLLGSRCDIEKLIHGDDEMPIPKFSNFLLIVTNCLRLQRAQ
jgi:hypothetical protein